MFRRSKQGEEPQDPQEPRRGRGGGRLRTRPRRRGRQRREAGFVDNAVLFGVLSVGLVILYHFWLGVSLPVALAFGLLAFVIGVSFNYWFTKFVRNRRKRNTSSPPSSPPPRRRR